MTRQSMEKEEATHGAGDVSTDVSLGPAQDGARKESGSGSGMDYEDDGLGLRHRFESHQQQHLQTDQDHLALERINTYRLQQQETVGSTHTHRTRTSRDHWVPIGAGKPFPPSLDQEQYVVEFNGSDDPMHPQNWPMKQRVLLGTLLTLCALMTSFESAVFPVTVPFVTKEFGFGREVGALGTTLYVLGFSAGPVFWAPTSELFGRRWLLVMGFLGFSIFTIACATAKDTQTLMLCRFFAGLFAASPVTLVPASLSDLFNNMHRGIAIASYTLAMFIGPYIAPFVAGYIANSYLGWRFVFYIPAFVSFFNTGLLVLFARETYAPVVLVHKAALIRRQTLNWGVHARQEAIEVDFKDLITKNLARPFRILFTEPIAFLVTVYMSFIYGLAYALLQAYPVVFQGVYGFKGGNSGLPFIGLIVGLALAAAFVLSFQGSYVRKLQANNNVPVPEWRLPPCIVGGVAFSGGLFWYLSLHSIN